MSDDEADPELLELLRQSLGISNKPASSDDVPTQTGVLKDAEYICDNALDVSISPSGTKAAAKQIWETMRSRGYSTRTWSEHELHPKTQDEDTVNFIFTLDLLNFSFWPELPAEEAFAVDYRGKHWTGYWSLVACLQRALDEGIPITVASLWESETAFPATLFEHIFRSATSKPIPLLSERINLLRSFSATLLSSDLFQPPTFLTILSHAKSSAARLVGLLTTHFPSCFDDIYTHYHTAPSGTNNTSTPASEPSTPLQRPLRLHKRAQILAADLWACFSGTSHGFFTDISHLTAFADYRVPQILHHLHVLTYSPRLEHRLRTLSPVRHGDDVEIEIRGCAVWAVELLRRTIVRDCGEAARAAEKEGMLNAVLLDFYLYDACKEMERGEGRGQGERGMLPHHRTRCIWY